MKALKDLSRDELLNILFNMNFDIYTEECSCATCGEGGAIYSYICDKCQASLEESN